MIAEGFSKRGGMICALRNALISSTVTACLVCLSQAVARLAFLGCDRF